MSNDIGTYLEYLSELQRHGKSYNTINIHRSALSQTLEPLSGTPIGQNHLTVKLLRGCYNRNPPQPRYLSTWDPEAVLSHIRTLGDNEDLELPVLAAKLATLLALSTLMRVSELAAIDAPSITFEGTSVSFHLSKPRKAQHSGPAQCFSLKRSPDRSVCPVVCLGFYVYKTDFLRTVDNRQTLFIGLIAPHKAVTGNSIARWIKTLLSDAGIDTGTFSAHSTRSAAASDMLRKGAPIDAILRAGHWSSNATFNRFYNKDLGPSA